jgi:hypothetical protein
MRVDVRNARANLLWSGAFLVAVGLVLGGCQRSKGLDAANELPFGFVDTPAAGAQVGLQFKVRGWAMDDRGVKEIRLYVDRHFLTRTELKETRPDVSRTYAKYARGSDVHGWSVAASLAGATPKGGHLLLVQVEDSDGATRDLPEIAIVVR